MGCLFLFTLTVLTYIIVSARVVTPEHDYVYVVTNGSVILSCPEAGSTSWLTSAGGGSQLVTVTAVQGVSVRESELSIHGFQPSLHAGQYYCVATADGLSSVSCPITVHHARIQAGQFQVNPSNTTATVNSTVVLACKAPFSAPVAEYHWKKNGRTLNLTDPRLTVLSTGNLYILDAQLGDAGEYQCIAENPVTRAKRRSTIASLTVSSVPLDPPPAHDITATPSNQTKAVGEAAVFECVTSGHPSPIIFWEKLYSQRFPITGSVLTSGVLVIDPVTSDEGGTYRCISTNQLGERVFTDVQLEVKGPPVFTHTPPADLSLEGSTTLTWALQDSGSVQVLLFWNGVLLDEMSGSGELSFTHTTSGEGVYQSLAIGSYGCARSTVLVSTVTTTTTPEAQTSTTSSTTEAMPTTASPTTTTTPTTSPTETTPTTSSPATTYPDTTTDSQGQTTPTQPLPGSGDSLTTQLPVEYVMVLPEVATLTGPDPIELVCTASSQSTRPTLSWFDSFWQEIQGGLPSNGSEHHSLSITVSAPGTYTCVAQWQDKLETASIDVATVPLAVDIVDKEISARVGEGVELVCVGEGRGVAVEWWRGSTSLGKGLVTSEKEGHLLSKYQIDSVTQRDAGEYACRVTSPYFPDPLEDKATVTVLDPPATTIGPPVIVGVERSSEGGVVITWDSPQTEEVLLGYKINVGRAEPIDQIALYSTDVDTWRFFVSPAIFTKYGEEVTVIVWAYSLVTDGEPVKVVVSPFGETDPFVIGPPVIVGVERSSEGGVVITWDPPQTEEVLLGYKINVGRAEPIDQIALYSTDVDTQRFFVTPAIFTEYGEEVTVIVWAYSLVTDGEPVKVVVSPFGETGAPTSETLLGCSAYLAAPHSATLTLTHHSHHTPVLLTHTCTEALVTQTVDVSMATDRVILEELLPSCAYIFHVVYTDGEQVSCDLVTPPNEVNISASVHRHGNGSVSLRWILPRPLRSQSNLTVEANWGHGWRSVLPWQHFPLKVEKEHTLQLRFLLAEWVGVANVTIPAVPVPMETTSPVELGLLYGVVLGGLLILIVIALIVILSLKYIQVTRRESDKVSDEKEKERDHFRRMRVGPPALVHQYP